MKVIGIGAQDDLEYAERFVAQTGTTFTMLWDPTFDSWNHYGIRNNSDFQVLDRSGDRLGDRFNGLDTDRIEELLAST